MSKVAEFDDNFANTLLQANDSSSVSESQLNQGNFPLMANPVLHDLTILFQLYRRSHARDRCRP